MDILTVKFRGNNIECLLALHGNVFVLMISKNYIFGFREIFGDECFVVEMFQFLYQRNTKEVLELLGQIGVSESEFQSTIEDFNNSIGKKEQVFSVSYCNNRIVPKQLSLF